MAPRKMPFHPDEVRQKIQASQLVNRLQGHAFGDHDLSATQLKAIEILLRKTVPDLSSMTVAGDPDNPINHSIKVTFVRPRTA